MNTSCIVRAIRARPNAIFAFLVLLAIAAATRRADAARYVVWATDEFEKIDPDRMLASYPSQTYLWSTTPTDSTMTLYGARGEWIGCQLVIHAAEDLSGVDVTAGDLVFGGHRIPADSVKFCYEYDILVNSRNPDQPGKAGAGAYRDALIPFRDPYSAGGPRVAGPFSVARAHNEVVWIDIHVPENVPAGLYQGDVVITESTSLPRRVHVRMNVWNFTMPARSGLAAWVGLHPEFFAPGEETDPGFSGLNAASWDILQRYELMAHEHGFTMAHKNMAPDVTFDVTGAITRVDWSRYDQFLGPVIDGTLFPDHQPPSVWMLPIRPDFRVPFRTPADANAVTNWTREVADHFQAMGWPLDNAFAWVYDEPRIDSSLVFPDEIVSYAVAMRAGSPLVNILLTDAVEDGSLVGSCDWLCSKGDKYFPPEMDSLKALGLIKKKMFYQSYAEPALPVETIDVNGNAFRIWPWIARRYGTDGLLYWAANYWNTAAPYDSADGQSASYNDGQGTFFYPGAKLDTEGFPKIAGPVSSFRMKALRRGLSDYALLERLASRGQATRVDSLVNAMVSSALCATHSAIPEFRGGSSRYLGPFADPRWTADQVSEWKQNGSDWWNARLFVGDILSEIGEDALRTWVLSPNGGDNWSTGQAQSITWETSGGSGSEVIDLFLSRDGGATVADTIALGTPNDGEFTWTVGSRPEPAAWIVMLVRGTGGTASDASDASIAIVDGTPPVANLLAPNGGETWVTSDPESIRWIASNNDTVTAVNLHLSTDGGLTFPLLVASGVANSGLFVWTVPDTIPGTTRARLRVSAVDPAALTGDDVSDADFRIIARLAVLSPNGGETWHIASPETIRWNALPGDSAATVSLLLSTDGGATFPVTIASGQPNDGRAVWTVPPSAPLTSNARVRIAATAAGGGLTWRDASNGSFAVATALNDLAVGMRLLQNPVITSAVDVYAITSKEIMDTSLVVTLGGVPIVMAPSDTALNLWHGGTTVRVAGVMGLNACARDFASQRSCDSRSVQVAMLRSGRGGAARTPHGEATLTVPPFSTGTDILVIMGRESVTSPATTEAWPGAHIEAVYDVGPEGRNLLRPASLRLRGSFAGGSHGLAVQVGGNWLPVPSWHDPVSHELVASIIRMGRYAVISSPTTSLSQVLPLISSLEGNRPNPFNPVTTIRYVLAHDAAARLRVYDSAGRTVATLVDEVQGPGVHEVTWHGLDNDGREVPSGVYFYRLEADGVLETRKMVLLK